jgi:hypothetical protein
MDTGCDLFQLLLSSDAEVILIGVEYARIVHVRFLNVEYIDDSRQVRVMGKTGH